MQLPRDAKSYYTEQVPPDLRPAAAPSHHTPVVRRRLVVEFDVPLATKSEPNQGGTRKAAIARKTATKRAIVEVVGFLAPPSFDLPLTVTLTRLGVKRLDDDNLRGALKVVRDEVARWLRMDDGDPGIAWKYRQRPSWAAGVRVRVEYRESKHAHA